MWKLLSVIVSVFISLVAGTGSAQRDCLFTYPPRDASPRTPAFVDVATAPLFETTHKQSLVRTSPNCLFPQYDAALERWDIGGFCLEETLTGGGCVGDVNADGFTDIFYPRMDGPDILYINRDGKRFEDLTERLFGVRNGTIRSNGCVFFDIDNDGDLDLYVSTVADTQFYLYVQGDDGTFTEQAVARGLGNQKPDNAMTAGFTLAVADYNNDGYLDVITTEWLPWLDEVSGVQCRVGESGAHCTVEIHSIDSAVEYFRQLSDRRSHNATVNMTNSRLYRNVGAAAPGYFIDATVDAQVKQSYKSQSKRTEFMGAACKRMDHQHDLEDTLEYLLETPFYAAVPTAPTPRQQFRRMVNFLSNSKYVRRKMAWTPDKTDSAGFVYLKVGGALVEYEGTLTVLIQPREGKPSQVDIVVGGKGNEQPTLARGQHTWKSLHVNPAQLNRLDLDVGGSYGLPAYFVGLRCRTREGCDFDLHIFSDPGHAALENSNCVNGKADLVTYAGDFAVDLVSPWLQSEPFVWHCVQEMQKLNLSSLAAREMLRDLFRAGKTLDGERYERMLNTSNRISEGLAVLNRADRDEHMANLREHQDGKRKMNHLLSFPLVGSFQFSAQFSDLDTDGYQDLIISGDFGTSEIFWNNGNGTFTPGFFHLLEDLLDNSMGATVGDYNQDGKMDVMFTSTSISDGDLESLNAVAATAGMILSFRGNHLYQNAGSRRFVDVTEHAGVRESGWGWGAFFFDFDNDGDLDVLNGNGMDDPETTDDDWAVQQRMKLYVNQGRDRGFAMVDEATIRGIASMKENRAAMSFDFDNDGDLDVFVVNHGDVPSLYRNEGGNYYDFLRVQVLEENGRESIGAKVYVRTTTDANVPDMVQEIGSTAAFLGQGESIAHFGLGLLGEGAVIHQLRVVWPRRAGFAEISKTFLNVPARKLLVVRRPGKNARGETNELPACTVPAMSTREQAETAVGAEELHRNEEPSAPVPTVLEQLQSRYRRAARFFEAKMANVDDVIRTAAGKHLSDTAVVQLLEKKYPFVRIDQ